MVFDPRALFGDLAEQERLKGHHSPEGAAIRTLSRALSGWMAENLNVLGVLVLCERAIEDWLKARLGVKPWSSRGVQELLPQAVERDLVSRLDAVKLQRMILQRIRLDDGEETGQNRDVEVAVQLCIDVVAKHWR